jgi:hypothetical protein
MAEAEPVVVVPVVAPVAVMVAEPVEAEPVVEMEAVEQAVLVVGPGVVATRPSHRTRSTP